MAYILIVTTMIILFVKQNFNKKLIFFSSILLFIFIKYFTYYYYGITFNPHEDTFGESFLSKIDLNFLILRSWQITSWYFAYFLANPITLTSLISLVIIFKYYNNLISKFNYLYFFFVLKFSIIFVTFSVTSYPMPFQVKYALDRVISHSSALFLIVVYFVVIRILKDKNINLNS